MPKEFSSIENVYGKGLTEAGKANVLQGMEGVFNDQKFGELEGLERVKTPMESQTISLVNEATNSLRNKYGLKNFDIPENNIHVVDEGKWPEENGDAFFSLHNQAVVMKERPSSLSFAKKAFHEMTHFKSYSALQIPEGGERLTEYRMGLAVTTRTGEKRYFNSLNEAVTEELARRFTLSLKDNPSFQGEFQQRDQIFKDNPALVDGVGQRIPPEEIFLARVAREDPSIGRKEFDLETFSYKQERDMLNGLTAKLYEANKDKFKDPEGVFDVFAKAMLTGNILPVGRIIDRTFGKGTLRQIGELEGNLEAQMRFIESLGSKEATGKSEAGKEGADPELKNLGAKYESSIKLRERATRLKAEATGSREKINQIRQEVGLPPEEVETVSGKLSEETEGKLKEAQDEIDDLEKRYLELPDREEMEEPQETREEETGERTEETEERKEDGERDEEQEQERGEEELEDMEKKLEGMRKRFVERFIRDATKKFLKDFKKDFGESINGDKAAQLLVFKVRYAVETGTKEWIKDDGDMEFEVHTKISFSGYETEEQEKRRYVTNVGVRFNITEAQGLKAGLAKEQRELVPEEGKEELEAAESAGIVKKELKAK